MTAASQLLVVEDDEMIRAAVAGGLRLDGYEVLEAGTLAEGIGLLDSRSPELVLIDWEWAAAGPAALDLAPVLWKIPLICDPSQPFPEACWSYELLDYYFERYRSAGGSQTDLGAFRRTCDLSQVASWVHSMPSPIGNQVRAQQGLARGARLVGVPEEARTALLRSVLTWCERTTERVTRSVRRWLT